MAERGVSQRIPIELNALRAQTELPGQLDKPGNGKRIVVDQIAAADRADLGIDPVLRAKAKETGECRLARYDVIIGAVFACFLAH